MRLLLIALGGALGTVMRYGAAQFARRLVSPEWPIGTFAVNVLGCFILAFLSEMLLRGFKMPEDIRLAIAVGFCGGLTTYSSLNQETLAFMREGHTHLAILYFMATVAMCAGASVVGLVVARMFSP
jgi:fluoride exporter